MTKGNLITYITPDHILHFVLCVQIFSIAWYWYGIVLQYPSPGFVLVLYCMNIFSIVHAC